MAKAQQVAEFFVKFQMTINKNKFERTQQEKKGSRELNSITN
jgi:hypothetical protein